MVPIKIRPLGEKMSGEKKFDELVSDRDKQQREFEKEISEWKKSLSKEELEQMAAEEASGKKRNRLFMTFVVSLVIIPSVIFYAAYGGNWFDEEYLEAPDNENSKEYEAYTNSTYALTATCCLPLIVWYFLPFAKDPFTRKEEEVMLQYPLLGKDDDDLAIMASDRLEGTEEGALMEAIESGKVSLCPQCNEFTLERKGLAGRGVKGALRGYGGVARWAARQTGGYSIVGSSGGIFDSVTADVAFKCFNCGYQETNGEYLDRRRN